MVEYSRKFGVKFQINNIAGKMNVAYDHSNVPTVDRYVFCHPSYKITASLRRDNEETGYVKWIDGSNNEKDHYYTRYFRRSVLWDFGDGHTYEGPSATHSYTKPGKYTITCTFFDIQRHGFLNQYKVNVVVKEVIPTELQFNTDKFKTAIKCSKIEQIQEISATLSNNCAQRLDVVPSRTYIDEKEEEIEKEYDKIKKSAYSYLNRYWCFMQNDYQNVYRSGNIKYRDRLIPVTKYTPQYDDLYGAFEYDESIKDESKRLYFVFWWVNPYANVENRLKSISYVNPDYDFLSQVPANQERITTEVKQAYLKDSIPSQYTYVGARAFIDVYFKSDFLKNRIDLYFNFDYDNQQSQTDILSSRNYINTPPMGLSLSVTKNTKADVHWVASSDGFIHFNVLDEENRNKRIDDYLLNGIVRNKTQRVFLLPIIRNETLYSDGTSETNIYESSHNYYIPKDLMYRNYNLYVGSDCDAREQLIDGFDKILSHVKCYSLTVYDSDFTLTFRVEGDDVIDQQIHVLDESQVVVPLIKQHKEDFDTLIQTYMPHKMFSEADNLKDALRAAFKRSGFIDYMMTYSQNFVDNISNYKTCFLQQFISILQSMGEDVTLFESNNFEGVNDLRDFVRLLSINHTQLVGHGIPQDYDIVVREDNMGANVGDQIFASDILDVDNKSCIRKVTRDGVVITIKDQYDINKIIVHDKYTNETWLVDTYNLIGNDKCIGNYQPKWNWLMMFPKRFDAFVERELTHAEQQDKNQLIESYYDFYLLNTSSNIKRVGNLIDEDYITSELEDVKEWDAQWGISYKCLLKLLSMYTADAETGTVPTEIETIPSDESEHIIIEQKHKKNHIDQTEMKIMSGERINQYHPFKEKFEKYDNTFTIKEMEFGEDIIK